MRHIGERNLGIRRGGLKEDKQLVFKDKIMDKVFLQTSLERNPSKSFYIVLLDLNFENSTVKLHILYALNMHVKFRSNQMLFTIQLINLFFMHNFRPQKN